MATIEERGESLIDSDGCAFDGGEVTDPEQMDTLLNRLVYWVDRFEERNPNPAVRAQHPEYFLLRDCLEVIEALVEVIEPEDLR